MNNIKELNKFINELSESSRYMDCVKNFNLIVKYISQNNINITPEIFMEIQNNKKFYNIIKVIVEYNLFAIRESKLETIFDNEEAISLIELYCMVNNVDINDKKDEIVESKDIYTDDSIRLYLNEINHNLLSVSEERRLGFLILEGDEDAKKKLIEGNLSLTVSIAKRYAGKSSLTLLDLIQEGNIGLITAANKFDVRKNIKFSTYATWWIKQSIVRASYEKGRIIKVPVHRVENYVKYNRKKQELIKENGFDLTLNEIAEELNMTLEDVIKFEQLSLSVSSINENLHEDSDLNLQDLIVDENCNIENNYFENEMQQEVVNLLDNSKLTDREKYVIINRFGLFGVESKTLENLGNVLNITRERVRQIENGALIKLIRSEEIEKLTEYFNNSEYIKEKLKFMKIVSRRSYKPKIEKVNDIAERELKLKRSKNEL